MQVRKQYRKSLFVKTSYAEEFKKVIIIIGQKKIGTLKPAYEKKPGLSEKKKDDLDLLKKNHIPKYYETFYNN